MTRSLPTLLLGLTALLAACSQTTTPSTPAAPVATAPTRPADLTPLGTLALGTDDLAEQAVSANPVGGFTFTKLGATTRSEDSLYVYLATTYRIKNTGTVPRSNVTLLAVSTPQTYPDSPLKSLKLANGADAGSQVTKFRPTHGMTVTDGTPSVDPTRASLQLYSEQEVEHLNGQNGIGVAYPWGYVVTADGGGRTLAPGGEGTVTVAAKIRKSPGDAAVTTAASFSALYVLATDSTQRVTVAPDEPDGTRAKAVATALNGALVVLTPMKANLLGSGDCVSPACEIYGVGNVAVFGPIGQPRLSIDPTKVFRIQGNIERDSSDHFRAIGQGLNFLRNYDQLHHNIFDCQVELTDGVSMTHKSCSSTHTNSFNHDFNLYRDLYYYGFCYGWSREVRKSQTSYQSAIPAAVWGYPYNGSGSTLYVSPMTPYPEMPELIETTTLSWQITGPIPGSGATCDPSSGSSSSSEVRPWGFWAQGLILDLPPLSTVRSLSRTIDHEDSQRHETVPCGEFCTERYDIDQTLVETWQIDLIDEY